MTDSIDSIFDRFRSVARWRAEPSRSGTRSERASPRSGAQRWPRSIDGPRAIIPGDIEPAGFDLSRKRRSSTRYANNGHAIMITSSARSGWRGKCRARNFACVHSLSVSLTQGWIWKWILEKSLLRLESVTVLEFSKKRTRLEGTARSC